MANKSQTQMQKLEKPSWLKLTEKEVKDLILKIAETEPSAEKIGLILRDQYGVPDVKIYGLKINKVLGPKFVEPTSKNHSTKLEKVIGHYKKNKQDKRAERSLIITKAKLKKITDYQKK